MTRQNIGIFVRVTLTIALLVLAVAPARLPLYAHEAEQIVLDAGGFGLAQVEGLEAKAAMELTLDLQAGDRVAMDLQGENDALVVSAFEAPWGPLAMEGVPEAFNYLAWAPEDGTYTVVVENMGDSAAGFVLRVVVSPAPLPTAKIMTQDADGQTIPVIVDEPFQVQLNTNAGDGFTWTLDAYDDAVLAQVGEPATVLLGTMPGAMSAQIFTFNGIAPGMAQLNFANGRASDTEAAATYSVDIDVVAAGDMPAEPLVLDANGAAQAQGTLAPQGMASYVIALDEGAAVQAAITPGDTGFVLTVVGADGMPLLTDHAGASNFEQTMPATQEYTFKVINFGDAEQDYTFALTVSEAMAAGAPPWAAGMSLNTIPGVYVSAVYPAADASGLVQMLELYENQNAQLLSFYLGNDVPIVEQGTWASDDPSAVTLTLTGQADQAYATPAVADYTFDAGKLDDGTMVLTKLWEIAPDELEAGTMPKLPDTPPTNEDPSGVYVSAVYPAADASGMVELLALYANNNAELNSIYIAKDAPVVELGTWQLNAEGAVEVMLTGTADKSYEQPMVTTYTRGGDALDDGLFVLFQLAEVTPEAMDAAATEAVAPADDATALGTELVTKFFDALQAGDADAVGAMLAPAFQLIRFSGERYDAANYLDNLPVFEAYELSNVYVTEDGDVLVVTYDVMTDATMDDGEVDYGALAPRLSVFQQIDGVWKLLAHANLASTADNAADSAAAASIDTALVVDRKAQVAAGGIVDIELPGIPTTGYIWQVVTNDESILLPIDYQFIADTDATGSGGVEKFSFHAMAPGTVDLRMVQSQPWVTDAPPSDTFGITVEVIDTWPSDEASITVGMEENGQDTAIQLGNVLMVVLQGAAGDNWQLTEGDAMVVQPLGDWVKVPTPGDGTTALFKHAFLGVQGGTADLQFDHLAADGSVVDAYDLKVEVLPMAPGSSGAVNVTEAESGGDLTLIKGDTLVVRVPANPTTGYDWRAVNWNEAMWPAPDNPQYAADSELTGAGGVYTFRFLAEEAGEAAVQVGEFAPGAEEPDKTLDYNVKVVDPAPLTGDTVNVTDADAGKPVTLSAGDIFNVTLPSQPSTGYFWFVLNNDGSILRLQPESGFIADPAADPNAVGTPGVQDFRFRTMMPGKVTLKIGEMPPGSDVPDETLAYEVTVE